MPGCGYDPLCDHCVEEIANERLALTAGSPSSTPETDALRELYENHEHRATVGDIWELCESLERERDQARTAARKLRDAFTQGEQLPWENADVEPPSERKANENL
jgi:hypothetical protein